MEELPTHPAVLATETVPVPLTSASPLVTDEASDNSSGLGWVWKLALAVLVVYWLAKHWL